MAKTRNSDALASFTDYCRQHPNERFWQALRNWSGWPYILAATTKDYSAGPFKPPNYTNLIDTFGWEGMPRPAEGIGPPNKEEP